MRRWPALLLLLAAPLSSQSACSGDGCLRNSDCSADMMCSAGECVLRESPEAAGGEGGDEPTNTVAGTASGGTSTSAGTGGSSGTATAGSPAHGGSAAAAEGGEAGAPGGAAGAAGASDTSFGGAL